MKTRKLIAVFLSVLLLFSVVSVSVSSAGSDGTIKNVIYMIGDGMGENHLLLAREQGYDLFMDREYDERGQQRTRSSSSAVTDSAAGATALACSVRTHNSYVGVYKFDLFGALVRPRSITENAIRHGMRTGIVTTDGTTGATPAGFSAHARDRNMAETITRRQLKSDIDLIWGAAVAEADPDKVRAKGWTYVSTLDEMNALEPGERSFGQFSWDMWRLQLPEGDNSPTLEQMTVKAIELLNYNNENGFFMMVEGAHIDKNSHRTEDGAAHFDEKVRDAAEAVKGFDNAIRAAVEFAREDGHTLVVVTADHETGDLYRENGVYTYHSGSHTGKNVPVLVFGCDDFLPSGVIDNTDIAVLMAERLGWEEKEFPRADPGLAFEWMTRLFRS